MWHTVYFLFQMHYLYECCSNYVIIQKLMHNNKPKDHQRNANGRECFLFKLWIHISYSLFLEGYKKRRFANLIEDSANVKSLSTGKEMKSMFPSLCLSPASLEIWTASENWLIFFTFLFWPNGYVKHNKNDYMALGQGPKVQGPGGFLLNPARDSEGLEAIDR